MEIEKGQKSYKINLEDFSSPSWWYDEIGIKKKDISQKLNLSKVMQFGFQNHPYSPKSKNQNIEIERIIFSQSFYKLGTVFTIFYLFLLIISYIVLFLLKKPPIPEPKSDFDEKDQPLSQIIETYIMDNYKNHDLTISSINRDTGIPLSRIRSELKKKYKRTFKQYLTEFRMKKVKELLNNTDKTVLEIANSCGYRHVTTLNRIFKELEKVSPLEYRSELRKQSS